MAWWDHIGSIFKGGKDVAEVFVGNKENSSQRQHEQKMADISRDLASLKQFLNEFQAREKSTWWDSLVDGLNRLPRPLLTTAVLSFFVLAPLDPVRFLQIAKAYELMPPGYWALLSVIIGFYFGGRMQVKSQDFTVRKDVVKAAKELIEIKHEFRQLDDDLESEESKIYEASRLAQNNPIKNGVIENWLNNRAAKGRIDT